MVYSQYFANFYTQARKNFIQSCASRATFVRSWQHPLRGIEGEKLYVDLGWFGDIQAEKVLVTISGTHGVEGFCGSGIQVAAIETGWYLQGNDDVAIVAIHGLNPWGMSHLRRVNEDSVDLNRNFLDFQQPLPRNTLYEDLADVIVPQEWTQESQASTFQQIFDYLYQSESGGTDLGKGQYHYWYAPFYGGEVPTWSNRVLQRIIQKYLQDRKIVGLLDYHTGLGQYATGQLIISHPVLTPQYRLATAIWGQKIAISGGVNSVVPYAPQGTLISALQQQLKKSLCIAAVYEFGTIAETEVFNALREDCWLHAYGDLNSPQAREIKQNTLSAFYSDRPDWQETVCNLALKAQTELLLGLQSEALFLQEE